MRLFLKGRAAPSFPWPGALDRLVRAVIDELYDRVERFWVLSEPAPRLNQEILPQPFYLSSRPSLKHRIKLGIKLHDPGRIDRGQRRPGCGGT